MKKEKDECLTCTNDMKNEGFIADEIKLCHACYCTYPKLVAELQKVKQQ